MSFYNSNIKIEDLPFYEELSNYKRLISLLDAIIPILDAGNFNNLAGLDKMAKTQ